MPSIPGCLPGCFRRSTNYVELDDVKVPSLEELTRVASDILKNTPDFREKKTELKQIFVEMSGAHHDAHEVVKALKTLTKDIADSEGVFKILERLVELMPVELLNKMLGEGVTFEECAQMLQDDAADHVIQYKDSLPPDFSHRLSAIGSTLSDGAFQVLANAVMILGFAELVKPMESEGQKIARPQKVLLTITIYTTLYAMLCGFMGLEYGAAAFTGFLVTMAILSVVYNKIKLPPASLSPGTRNLTDEAKKRELPKVSVDPKIYRRCADALRSRKTCMRHPLLIAEPGVGKTSAVHGLADAAERGDLGEEFKKKEFHFIDGAKMKGADKPDLFDASTSVLDKVNAGLGSDRNRDKTIYGIDEIHELWRGAESSDCLGSQLKNKLSGGSPFPRVIGTTTWGDYAKYMKSDEALFRRFCFIELPKPGEATVLDILRKALPQGVMDDPGALEYLCVLTKGKVNSAKLILDACVDRLQTSPDSKLRKADDNVSELKEKKATLFQDKKHAKASERVRIGRDKLKVEQDIKEAERKLKRAEAKRAAFAKACKRWEGITPTLYRRVQRISVLRDRALGLRQRKQIGVLALMEKFVEPEIKARIIDSAEKLGVEQVISIDLIKRIHAEQEREKERVLDKLEEAGEAKAKKGPGSKGEEVSARPKRRQIVRSDFTGMEEE